MDGVLEIWNRAPHSVDLLKSAQEAQRRQQEAVEPKSAIIDPTNILNYVGTRAKPSAITYAILRHMSKVPAISAIIQTRLNQVGRFSRRPRFEGDTGFKIVLKDKDAKMNDAQKREAFRIEEFFLKTGFVQNRKRKDNFNQFLRKVVRDTLELDALTFENVPNLRGQMSEIWAVDAGTIELVSDSPVGDGGELPVYVPVTKRGMTIEGEIAYVQRVSGQIIAEYSEDELAYGIRNPRTDLDFSMFGMSELETLIEIVTAITNSFRYNASYFTASNLPQGVMEIVGKYKDQHLEGFKRAWTTLTSGAVGKWKVPIMAMEEGQGLKFTQFKQSNRDMEYNEFMEFLFNIACAVYQIDPSEVGFKSWTSGSQSSLSGDDTNEKQDHSLDKGFLPLMQFLGDLFNHEVVDRINPDFALTWVGLDDEDAQSKWALYEQQVNMGALTMAELWKREDMPMDELKDPETGKYPDWAYAPANSALVQVFMADKQAQQQQELQAQQTQGQMQLNDQQHKNNMEAKKSDQDHQLGMQLHQQLHQGQMQDDQQNHQLGSQMLQGVQQESQQQANNEHQANMQQDAQNHQLGSQMLQGMQQEAQQKDQQKHEVGMNQLQAMQQEHMQDKNHQQNMEGKKADQNHDYSMANFQNAMDKDNKKDDQKAQAKTSEVEHKRNMEGKKADQEHQIRMERMKHDNARNDKKEDNQVSSKTSEVEHRRNMQSKREDHAHQLRLEREKAKAKRADQKKQKSKVRKSLLSDSDDIEIVISWDNY